MASRRLEGPDSRILETERREGADAQGLGAAVPALTAAPAMPVSEPTWVVHLGAADQRTVAAADLRAALQAGTLAPQTMVWRAGLSGWVPVGSVGELQPSGFGPGGLGWLPPHATAEPPNSAQLAAERYLSTHGPGLGDTTTYAAWDPPEGRAPSRPAVPAADRVSELIATGLVVFGIAMSTLYLLSLGGAFEPGSPTPHPAPSQVANRAAK